MKQIALTEGKFALVDDVDFEELSRYKWYAWPDRRSGDFYAIRSVRVAGKSRLISMGRELMGLERGDNRCVDFISRNTLDNRRSNLRIATVAQNQMNSGLNVRNTTGYKGVRFLPKVSKWRADIRILGRKKFLGNFVRAELAYAAYCAAAVEHHGEFAAVA